MSEIKKEIERLKSSIQYLKNLRNTIKAQDLPKDEEKAEMNFLNYNLGLAEELFIQYSEILKNESQHDFSPVLIRENHFKSKEIELTNLKTYIQYEKRRLGVISRISKKFLEDFSSVEESNPQNERIKDLGSIADNLLSQISTQNIDFSEENSLRNLYTRCVTFTNRHEALIAHQLDFLATKEFLQLDKGPEEIFQATQLKLSQKRTFFTYFEKYLTLVHKIFTYDELVYYLVILGFMCYFILVDSGLTLSFFVINAIIFFIPLLVNIFILPRIAPKLKMRITRSSESPLFVFQKFDDLAVYLDLQNLIRLLFYIIMTFILFEQRLLVGITLINLYFIFLILGRTIIVFFIYLSKLYPAFPKKSNLFKFFKSNRNYLIYLMPYIIYFIFHTSIDQAFKFFLTDINAFYNSMVFISIPFYSLLTLPVSILLGMGIIFKKKIKELLKHKQKLFLVIMIFLTVLTLFFSYIVYEITNTQLQYFSPSSLDLLTYAFNNFLFALIFSLITLGIYFISQLFNREYLSFDIELIVLFGIEVIVVIISNVSKPLFEIPFWLTFLISLMISESLVPKLRKFTEKLKEKTKINPLTSDRGV